MALADLKISSGTTKFIATSSTTSDDGPSHAPAPFYISLANTSTTGALAHGFFLNSHGFSAFDIGKNSSGRVLISSPDPVMDYFLFAGPTPIDVMRQFTALTGRMSLPPKWSLGMKYDYNDRKQNEQFDETLTTAFASNGIAMDRVILEPGWQNPQYLRCFMHHFFIHGCPRTSTTPDVPSQTIILSMDCMEQVLVEQAKVP